MSRLSHILLFIKLSPEAWIFVTKRALQFYHKYEEPHSHIGLFTDHMAFPRILRSHLVSHRASQWEQLLRWISDDWMLWVICFTLFCVNAKFFQTTWQGSSPPLVRGTVPESSSRWQHRLLQKGGTASKKNPSTNMLLFLLSLRLSRPLPLMQKEHAWTC